MGAKFCIILVCCTTGLDLLAADTNAPPRRVRRNLLQELTQEPEQNNRAPEQDSSLRKRNFEPDAESDKEPSSKFKCLEDPTREDDFQFPKPDLSICHAPCLSKKDRRQLQPATPSKHGDIDIQSLVLLLPEFDGIEKIGSGDQASVYKVRLVEENKALAMKVFKNTKAKKNQLTTENQYAQQLAKNEHIISYSSFFEREKFLFISTEFFPKDLSFYLNKIADADLTISEEDIWKYITDIALGLKGFEEMDLVHRDIKPDNLFMTKEDRIVIGDLGLLISLNHDDSSDYSVQTGDARYLAIEAMEGAPNHKWDIASFGFSLLEMTALIELSAGGDTWSALRKLGGVDSYLAPLNYSVELKELIKSMVHPEPEMRPSATQILKRSRIKTILAERK